MQAAPDELPLDASMVQDLADRWLGLALPEECIEGVQFNLGLLAGHVALVRSSLDEIG